MQALLFVCLGNICRSPTAEAVVRSAADRDGLALRLDSAGTGDWHVGQPPDPRAIAAAARRGHDLSGLRARQVTPEDFHRFDLILAMDRRNRADLERLRPAANATPVQLFLDHAPGFAGRDLPDPWFDGSFEQVLDMIEGASAGLVAALARQCR